jgi:GAF domain-containing protein
MNDDQKTKEQLLEELAHSQELLEQERERSLALQEVSKRVAATHDTDEVLDLIVNEAARLVGADGAIMRLLEGDALVARAASDSISESYAAALPIRKVEEGTSATGHVLATKKPLAGDEIARFANPEALRVFAEQGRDPAAGAIVPLLANDRALGTITLADYTGHRRLGSRLLGDYRT